MMQHDLALFNKIIEELLADEIKHPVNQPILPNTLYETLDLSLNEEPCLTEYFEENLKQIVLHSPKTASKRFFNQLFGGRSSQAYLGELLAVMLNNSMYTYKAAGPQIGIEKTIIKEIIRICNFGKDADGTFAAGGSMTIFMAMLMARDAHNLAITTQGVMPKMTVYASDESHYSIAKNASFMGIGRNQVRYIATTLQGKMNTEILEAQIIQDKRDGFLPFCIIATAATTVLGAFDDIEPIAKIAKKHSLWLHVDGALGGSVIFSKKYKYLLKGLELANSFSVNAHKMLGTPLSTSIIIVHNKKHLYDSFSNEANYLYQTDGDDLNIGKISLQCGRRNDAFKFWTLWKAIGTNGIENIVNQHFDFANKAKEYLKNHTDYTLYNDFDTVTVCFNYKNVPAAKLCNLLYEKAEMMVGYGEFRDVTFVRLVMVNPENTYADIQAFFDVIESFVTKQHLA